jgi:hypothetical protein
MTIHHHGIGLQCANPSIGPQDPNPNHSMGPQDPNPNHGMALKILTLTMSQRPTLKFYSMGFRAGLDLRLGLELSGGIMAGLL